MRRLLVFSLLAAIFRGVPVKAGKSLDAKQVLEASGFGRDVFQDLTKKQKQSLLKQFRMPNDIKPWRDALGKMKSDIIVSIQLLGFDGSGMGEVVVAPGTLLKYLRAINQEMASVVLEPLLEDLAIIPKITFTVKGGDVNLMRQISNALHQGAAAAKAGHYAQHSEHHNRRKEGVNYALDDNVVKIPYHFVDNVIRTDFQSWEHPTFTIYLINSLEMHDDLYVYTYQDAGEHPPEPGLSCPGTMWVGPQPYMWIDIAAGPMAYGPGAGRQGQAFEHTMLHTEHYKQDKLNHGIIPDMAALIWSAVRHHVWPPIQHLEMDPKDTVDIVIVQMHESLSPPPDRLDQVAIERILQSSLSGVQHVNVREAWLPFADCDLCVASFSAAVKELVSTQDQALKIRTTKKTILDSRTLHAMLRDYSDDILSDASLYQRDLAHHPRQLPVFVFNMGPSRGDEVVLLDGEHKAVAFSDMVIVVSSEVDFVPSHFTCDFEYLEPMGSEVTRETLAALMTAGWGVPDTSTFYTEASGINHNYFWSVGNTPFSPLSHRKGVSAPLQEALKRNVVLAALNASVAKIDRLLAGFEKISDDNKIDRRSVPNHHEEILERLGFALLKVQEVARLMGKWKSAKAYDYTKSLVHDIKGLEKLAKRVNKGLKARIKCKDVSNLWSLWWAPVGAIALWPFAILIRKKIAAPKLEKLY